MNRQCAVSVGAAARFPHMLESDINLQGATMAPSRTGTEISEKLGRIAEAVDTLKKDREAHDRDVSTDITMLAGEIRGLNQTVQSTATQVALLLSQDLGKRMTALEMIITGYEGRFKRYDDEDCDRRLDKLESESRLHSAVIGGGLGLVSRIAGFIAASGIAGALFAKFTHLSH